jgi:hypothetical protein
MEPPPLCKEAQLVRFDNPERFTSIRCVHMMVLPKIRGGFVISEANQYLASTCTLHVNVGRLVFAGRQ